MVVGTVIAIAPAFNQLKVRDDDGNLYAAVVGHTQGLDLNAYQEGQRVTMEVEWLGKTQRLPKLKTIAPVAAP